MNGDTAIAEPPNEIEYAPQGTYLPPENWDLSNVRSQRASELQDPETLAQLYNLTHNEVGGQGPEAQQAFMESVFNRATARGQSLADTINDPNYYPAQSFKPAKLSDQHLVDYQAMLKNVVDGSNISSYATGNASGKVGFNGGPHTASYGGERFGIEGPDVGWHQRQAAAPTLAGIQGVMPNATNTGQAIRSAISATPQRALLAGLEPTAAAMQAAGTGGDAVQMQAMADQAAGVGADTGALAQGGGMPMAQNPEVIPESAGEGIVVSDHGMVPDVSDMPMYRLPNGVVQFGQGDNAIRYNPTTGMIQYDMGDRTFVQQGPMGKMTSYNNAHYYHDISTNRLFNLTKRDANGQPMEIHLPGAQPHIDTALWNKIIDMGAPIAHPDGSPFKNNVEAMQSLQDFQQAQGVPTKMQQHVIDQVTNKINSGRNPYIRPFLQQVGNYQSAMDNINLPSRSGVDDALLLASYYGIERPGYAPTQSDLSTLMNSFGLVGKAEVGAQRMGAVRSAISDLLQGKPISEDASISLNQGRIIPDTALPQMKTALQRVLEPRWKMYDEGIQPLRNQLQQAGVRNPELYLPDVKPDFIRDRETAQGAPSGAPAAPTATPAAKLPTGVQNAYDAAQRGLNSPDPQIRALAEETLKAIQNPSPTPTP